MQQLLIYFFIALGLSMDAFSLAIAYGTNKISTKKTIALSLCVGFFHYLMPYLASSIGRKIEFITTTGSNIIVALIFLLIAIEMYISKDEEIKGTITGIFSMIVFAFTVSIDSFSIGLALSIVENNLNVAFLIFSITSAIFTLLGLLLGKYLSKKLGKKATYFGIIILVLLAIKYLIN